MGSTVGERGLPILDMQMEIWSARLVSEVGIAPPIAACLASTIAREVRALDPPAQDQLQDAHGVTLLDRLDELTAFQGFMDLARQLPPDPRISRAQVLVQNYVCFVYLGESYFKLLRKLMPTGTATRKCCTYLTDNPVRAFRNAVAHASWRYKADFSGLEFWARKGAGPDDPIVRWETSQEDLSFWQALARCVAYALVPSA